MRAVLRSPALHFVLAGGLLFAARAWRTPAGDGGAERPRVVLAANDVARLRAQWTAAHGAPPDPEAIRALIEAAIDEEVLHREALRAGLARRDRLARMRLDDLHRFLGDASEADDGLAAHDVVVRRHLVSLMRLALSRPHPGDLPDDVDLHAHLATRAAELRQPVRFRLTHVYLSRDRHGPGLESVAASVLRGLRRRRTTLADAPAAGDAFLHGAHPPPATAAELDRVFGPGFGASVERAPLGAWIGPVRSAFGLHLVWVHERLEPRTPALDWVRSRVAHEVREARAGARLRARLDALRARYDIVVER